MAATQTKLPQGQMMATIGPEPGEERTGAEQHLNSSWLRRLFGARELSCEEVADLSSDYVDEELSQSVSSQFRRHIDSCENCNSFVATFRATVMTLRDLPRRNASADLRARIQECVEAEQAGPDAPAKA